jgi:hypothetical protein
MFCALVGSRRGWIFIISTVLFIINKIPDWMWGISALIFISLVFAEKIIGLLMTKKG